MGRLEDARGRLDRALARLEEAVQRPARREASETDPDTEAALAETRAEYEMLEARSREVSDRLDAAIERLHAVLKEDDEHGAG